MRRKKRFFWILVSGLLVAALLLTACGPAVVEEEEEVDEEEVEEEVVVEEEEEGEFVWADQGGWVRPEFVDDVQDIGIGSGLYQVYPYTLEEPQYGGQLTIVRAGDPTAFDPWKWTWFGVGGYVHENLLIGDVNTPDEDWPMTCTTYTPAEYRVGWLAESWEQPDAFTIIYTLREGIKFNAGMPEIRAFVGDREFVADDFVKCWSRWIGLYGYPRSPAVTPAQLTWDAVEAVDKHTLRIHNSQYDLLFLVNTSCQAVTQVYPMEIIEEYGGYDWRNYCGTGPFIMTDYVPGSSITFIKNEEYWDTSPIYGEDYPLPFMDGIKMLIVPDSSTQIAGLRAGKIDTLEVSYDQVEPLVKSNPELRYRNKSLTPSYYGLPKDKWPWDQMKFRQALQMAVNHQEIIDSLWNGEGECPIFPFGPGAGPMFLKPEDMPKEPMVKLITEPVVGGVAGNSSFVQEDSTVSAYEIYNWSPENPAKARALLDDVLGPGVSYDLEISTTSGHKTIDRLTITVEYWRAIGINAEIKYYEKAALTAMIKADTRPDISPSGGGSDPWRVITWYTWRGVEPLTAYNAARNRDPAYDKMVDDIMAVPGTFESKIGQMTDLGIYCNEAVMMFSIPCPYNYAFWQPWLKGGYRAQTGLCYAAGSSWTRNIWIDQDLKKFITGR